jgi:hypothetical protein
VGLLFAVLLAATPAWSQEAGQGQVGGYGMQMPPAGGGGMGQGGMPGRPPMGPPVAPAGRYQIVAGSYDAWRGGKLETVRALVRIDGLTGETWIQQERQEGGHAQREWVRIAEAR